LNPVSRCWLSRRQAIPRAWIKNSLVLDIGSRSERLVPDSVAVDIIRYKDVDIVADASYLPFRTGVADYVLGLELIEHLNYSELKRFLLEAERVGKEVILSTPNCGPSWILFWEFWKRTIGRAWNHAHLSQFQHRFLISLFEEYSYTILDSRITRWSLFYHLGHKNEQGGTI
jgi:hypothetical protein